MRDYINANNFKKYVHEQLELNKTYSADEILKMIDEQEEYDRDSFLDEIKRNMDENYDKGLDEAWRLARRMVIPAMYGGLGAKECEDIFGSNISGADILRTYSVQDVMARTAEYKKRIKVGDVVINTLSDKKYAILYVDESRIHGFCEDGTVSALAKETLLQTGRIVDVKKFLQQIGGV